MTLFDSQPYSDHALRDYVRRAIVLVGDRQHLEAADVEKRKAIEATAPAVIELPGWMQVIMVETGQALHTVPGRTIGRPDAALGLYHRDDNAIVFPSESRDLRYILAYQTAYHADAVLGGDSPSSTKDVGWSSVVTEEVAHQLDLPQQYRYAHPINDCRETLISRLQELRPTQPDRDQTAQAALLGDYLFYLARGGTHVEINNQFERLLPYAWPYFKSNTLKRLHSFAADKYAAATQTFVSALTRAERDLKRQGLHPSNRNDELQKMRDLRARYGVPIVDRIVTSYCETGVAIPYDREQTKHLNNVFVEQVKRERGQNVSLTPNGLAFHLDGTIPSLAAEFGSLCNFLDDELISYTHRDVAFRCITDLFAQTPGYKKDYEDEVLSNGDAFQHRDQFVFTQSFLAPISQISQKHIEPIKEFMSFAGNELSPVDLLDYFSSYFRDKPLVSPNAFNYELQGVAKAMTADLEFLSALTRSVDQPPDLKRLLRQSIDRYAQRHRLPKNPLIRAVSFARTTEISDLAKIIHAWPLALNLAGLMQDCGVSPEAAAHIRDCVAIDLAKIQHEGNDQSRQLAHFFERAKAADIAHNLELKTILIKSFAGLLPRPSPLETKLQKVWDILARCVTGNDAARDLSCINALNERSSLIASGGLTNVYLLAASQCESALPFSRRPSRPTEGSGLARAEGP